MTVVFLHYVEIRRLLFGHEPTSYNEQMTLLWHRDYKTPVMPLEIFFYIIGY